MCWVGSKILHLLSQSADKLGWIGSQKWTYSTRVLNGQLAPCRGFTVNTIPWSMNHITDTCPLTKFEGGLNLLHEVDDDAVIWLTSIATAALTK